MNQRLIHDLATQSDLRALASELTVKMYSVGFAVVVLVVVALTLL
tara:strand:+ start:1120 stop:1254 length:135 start_codon:yes stop_codon:yes gene_type:complete